jgi:hypothetical protein
VASVDATTVLDLAPARLHWRPFEHIVVRDFIDPGIYRELLRTFPTCPPSTGPTGYSCYWGDAIYDGLATSSTLTRAKPGSSTRSTARSGTGPWK